MKTLGFHREQPAASDFKHTLGRFEHILLFGKTGDGKTTCGMNPIMNDRIEAGYGMLIFDEKAKEHRIVKHLAARHGRLDDVVEIGKPHGATFNLLGNLSRKQAEKLARTFIKESHESFWQEGGINLCVDMMMFLIGLKEFYAFAKESFGTEEFELSHTVPKDGSSVTLTIPTDPLTIKELGRYIKDLVKYTILTVLSPKYVDTIRTKILVKAAYSDDTYDELRERLIRMDAMIAELNELAESLQGGKIKHSDGEASGFNGLLFSISAGISPLIANPYCNDPYGSDIARMLGEGKIVIVNTESFESSTLNVLLEQTLSSLSLRAKKRESTPVAILIDEANRVLTRDSDLKTDILRESKTEVVIAVQNHEQMIRKMGDIAWEAMMQNFKTQISFHGPMKEGKLFGGVDEITQRTCAYESFFFDHEHLDQTELLYQNRLGFYGSMKVSEHELLVYDHLRFDISKTLLFRDVQTKTEREVPYNFPAKGFEERFRTYSTAILAVRENRSEERAERLVI